MIQFEQVSKIYSNSNVPAVDNLNIEIESGKFCILVGPSGCGKTTTMKMINKLIEPSKGKIRIDGKDIQNIDSIELRLSIGYVIQDIGLFPHMTVAENIATVPMELGWKKDKIADRVDELLELVDLNPSIYRNKRPRELSGGQKQRIGVARALAADPPIMLMDEPFGALDPIARSKLQDEFLKIQEKIHKTIVFVTHDIDEAIKMGDLIAVMRAGKLIQYGTPMDILSNPTDHFVSELIGGKNPLKMMSLIKCSEFMRPITETVSPSIQLEDVNYVDITATAQDVLSEILRSRKRTIYVKDQNKQIKGTISFEDLLKGIEQNGDGRTT